MNLVHFLVQNARLTPDKDAIRCGSQKLTWQELDRQTDSLAAALQELGVKPGDRVGVLLPNSIAFLVSYWAAIKAGAVATPLNTMYRQEEIAYVFSNSGMRVLVTEAQFLPLIDVAWPASTAGGGGAW